MTFTRARLLAFYLPQSHPSGGDLPNPPRTAEIFRGECGRMNVGDPFLVAINATVAAIRRILASTKASFTGSECDTDRLQVLARPLGLSVSSPHRWTVLARFADALGRVQPLTIFRSTSLAVAILLTPLAVNLTSVGAIFKRLQNIGGSGLWSDSIYILSNVLRDGTWDAPVVVLDWGISTQLVGLSGGRLHTLDLYCSLNKLETNPAEVMEPAFSIQDCRYILHSENNTQFPLGRQRFFQAVSASVHDLKLINTIPTRLGEPLFEVYKSLAARG